MWGKLLAALKKLKKAKNAYDNRDAIFKIIICIPIVIVFIIIIVMSPVMSFIDALFGFMDKKNVF